MHLLQRRLAPRPCGPCRAAFRRGRTAGGAVRVVGERLAQVLLRFLVAAAEQPGHLEIPAAERAIGGALLKRGIELQHGLERFADRLAVFEPCRMPNDSASAPMLAASQKWPFGSFGLERRRRARGGHAAFERRAARRFGAVRAQPVAARAPASTRPRSPSDSLSAARCQMSAACRALARPVALARRARRRSPRVAAGSCGLRRQRPSPDAHETMTYNAASHAGSGTPHPDRARRRSRRAKV